MSKPHAKPTVYERDLEREAAVKAVPGVTDDSKEGNRRPFEPLSDVELENVESALDATFLGGRVSLVDELGMVVTDGFPPPVVYHSGTDKEGPTARVDWPALHESVVACTDVPQSGFCHIGAGGMMSKDENGFYRVLWHVLPLLAPLTAVGFEIARVYVVCRNGDSKSWHQDFATGRHEYWWRFKSATGQAEPVSTPSGLRIVINAGGLHDHTAPRPFRFRAGNEEEGGDVFPTFSRMVAMNGSAAGSYYSDCEPSSNGFHSREADGYSVVLDVLLVHSWTAQARRSPLLRFFLTSDAVRAGEVQPKCIHPGCKSFAYRGYTRGVPLYCYRHGGPDDGIVISLRCCECDSGARWGYSAKEAKDAGSLDGYPIYCPECGKAHGKAMKEAADAKGKAEADTIMDTTTSSTSTSTTSTSTTSASSSAPSSSKKRKTLDM